MAQPGSDLHYRLFAKLLMFITLLLGGLIGWAGGFAYGKATATELLQAGRLYERTTVGEQATQGETAKTTPETSDEAVATCYKEKLGAERAAKVQSGEAQLTFDEFIQVLPCSNAE